jgi:peptide/nickel transport system permease protein
MMRTVLPNVTGPVIVQLIITASLAIYTAAGLNFLGLGQAPPAPTWGGMLQTARSFIFHSTWYGVFPGLILFATIAAFAGLGRALDRGDQGSTRADIGTIA